MKSTCKQSFRDGSKTRISCPLHSGIYKLEETSRSLARILEAIKTIAAYKRGEVPAYRLQMCQSGEIETWLREIPGFIAFDLGRNVLPAIKALSGDRIPVNQITAIEKLAKKKLKGIVTNLERDEQTFTGSIALEYKRMKSGTPSLVDEIHDVLSLIDWVLEQCRHRVHEVL